MSTLAAFVDPELRSGELINLCFHGVGTPARPLERGEAPYWVTRELFLSVLDDIAGHPGVRLSFDDGNASDVDIALPALVERDLHADFFVLAGRLDARGSVSSDGVRALADAGMTVGSHGMAHRSWRGLSEADRRAEWIDARDRLEAAAGRPVDTAACPLGQYDRGVVTGLRRLGYRTLYTSDRRRARAGSWLQSRYSVHFGDTLASLRDGVLVAPSLSSRAAARLRGAVKQHR